MFKYQTGNTIKIVLINGEVIKIAENKTIRILDDCGIIVETPYNIYIFPANSIQEVTIPR